MNGRGHAPQTSNPWVRAAVARAASCVATTSGDGWVNGGAPLKVDTKATWIEWVKRQPAPY